jgi:hypothetical protein
LRESGIERQKPLQGDHPFGYLMPKNSATSANTLIVAANARLAAIELASVEITVARDLSCSAISSASHAVPVPAPMPIARPLRIRAT